MKPGYRYRYPPYIYRTDTDIPHISHIEPIPIPGSYRFFSYRYQYWVSVPGIGIIPGMGRTLHLTPRLLLLKDSSLCYPSLNCPKCNTKMILFFIFIWQPALLCSEIAIIIWMVENMINKAPDITGCKY